MHVDRFKLQLKHAPIVQLTVTILLFLAAILVMLAVTATGWTLCKFWITD